MQYDLMLALAGATYLSPKALTEEEKLIVVYIETSLVPRFPQFLFFSFHSV